MSVGHFLGSAHATTSSKPGLWLWPVGRRRSAPLSLKPRVKPGVLAAWRASAATAVQGALEFTFILRIGGCLKVYDLCRNYSGEIPSARMNSGILASPAGTVAAYV